MCARVLFSFFLTGTAASEIYTLSLHDALPISRSGWAPCPGRASCSSAGATTVPWPRCPWAAAPRETSSPTCGGRTGVRTRSEEHTSELQSRLHLVCRLLLEKKKKKGVRKNTHM